MKTATVLQAIAAMREGESVSFDTDPRKFGTILAHLAFARQDLEIELAAEHPTVRVGDSVPCKHEWYQGACIHCNVKVVDGRAVEVQP